MEENAWVPTLDESHLQEESINLISPKGVSKTFLVTIDGGAIHVEID